jgi:TolB protein
MGLSHSKPNFAQSRGGMAFPSIVCLCLLCVLAVGQAYSEPPSSQPSQSDKIILDITKPRIMTKFPIAVADFVSAGPATLEGRGLAGIIRHDLYLTALFEIVNPPVPIQTTANGEPDFEAWKQAGAAALIVGSFAVRGDELTLEIKLYDLDQRKLEIGKRYSGRINDHRRMIHKFADKVMEKLDKIPGCFSTKIAFVGDAQSREVFSMDFDGHNLAQLTRTRSLNLSPDWAPNGRNLVFTSYMNGKPDVWMLDLSDLKVRPVSTQSSLNASPRYSPDGNYIALSMSINGLPKIILVTPQGNTINRLTNGRGNDISPAWSPDGSAIAYVSDHAGSPQIYIVPSSGGQSRRLTLSTKYNTDPDWSPRGDRLAFTARIDGRFQICTIKTDGSDFQVLTTAGSNQDPSWSPDGRLIAFLSDRDGRRRIYVMDARGEIQEPVSTITGKCPSWSRSSW